MTASTSIEQFTFHPGEGESTSNPIHMLHPSLSAASEKTNPRLRVRICIERVSVHIGTSQLLTWIF
jgi:hypothetical protein